MKLSDFTPRIAPGDQYLTGEKLIGIEIGVDAGAHAEALLTYQNISRLYLVDPWPSLYTMGYTAGRLETKGFKNNIELLQMGSVEASHRFSDNFFAFVYIDQIHEKPVVAQDLVLWWPKVKPGGLLTYRNYTGRSGLTEAVDEFVQAQSIKTTVLSTEIVLWKPA